MAMTLFQLEERLVEVSDEMVEALENDDTLLLETLQAEFDGLHHARADKHEAYVHVIKNAEAASKAVKEQANAFYARAKALENLAIRLKETLKTDMIAHEEVGTEAGIFKLSLRKNSQPTIHINTEVEELPEEFTRVKIEADKTAIRKAIKAGVEIDGVVSETGMHVRIAVK